MSSSSFDEMVQNQSKPNLKKDCKDLVKDNKKSGSEQRHTNRKRKMLLKRISHIETKTRLESIEIDEIFAESSKRIKKTSISNDHPKDVPEIKKEKQSRIFADDFFDSRGIMKRKRRKTDEGYNIYTEEELQLNKSGGGTALCPFGCDCCF